MQAVRQIFAIYQLLLKPMDSTQAPFVGGISKNGLMMCSKSKTLNRKSLPYRLVFLFFTPSQFPFTIGLG
jgi:hypothetical protein